MKELSELTPLEIREEIAVKVMGTPKPVIPHDQADGDYVRSNSLLWRVIVAAAIQAKVVLGQTGAYKNTVNYGADFQGWRLSYYVSEYRNPDAIEMAAMPEVDSWHDMDSSLSIRIADHPAYESTGDGMLMVIEAMQNRKDADGFCRWYWSLHAVPLGYRCEMWKATGDTYKPLRGDIHVAKESDTAPMAVALAALAALRGAQ